MLGRGSLAVVFEYDFGKGCADGEKSRFNLEMQFYLICLFQNSL